MTKLKLKVTIFRLSGFKDFLKNVCFINDVDLDLEESSGFLVRTYYITLSGVDKKVKNAIRDIKFTLKKYEEKNDKEN
jgi:hypothetical protein